MKLFNQTIWAITPEMLQTMMSLAKENNKPPEAIAREMGKEMKDSNTSSTLGRKAYHPFISPNLNIVFRN